MNKKYKVLATLIEKIEISEASEQLENAGIPIRVENVKISGDKNTSTAYRILVPQDQFSSAQKLVSHTKVH